MRIFDFDAIEKVYTTALSDVQYIITYATLVAGIGALLFICTKVWKQWANGGQIDFYGLLRPFAILLALINFTYIPQVIDTITSPLTTFTKELRESKNELYNKKALELTELQINRLEQKANDLSDAISEEWNGETVQISGTKTEISWLDKFTGKVSNYINEVGEKVDEATGGIYSKVAQIASALEYFNPGLQFIFWLENLISHAISSICEYLCIAISSCIVVFAYLTKIILVLLGPLVFALALFPGFSNVLQLWFCRYINVCLWVPICNLIGYFMQSLTIEVVMNNAIASVDDPLVAQTYINNSNNIVATVFLIISIILYAMVPKISNWIISGDGSGMFADAVGSTAGRAGSIAARAVGAKIATKGIGKALGSAGK